MNITLGNYEIELGGDYPEGFDPMVQDNASKTKKLIDGEDTTVGFIYNCVYKQTKALEYLSIIKMLYCIGLWNGFLLS